MSKPRFPGFKNTIASLRTRLTKPSVEIDLPKRVHFQEEKEEKQEQKVIQKEGLDALKVAFAEKSEKDPAYKIYMVLEQRIRTHPKTLSLSPKEQADIFRFVESNFIHKFAIAMPSLAKQEEKDIEAQLDWKIDNFFTSPQRDFNQDFVTKIRNQIPDVIKNLGYMPLYQGFEQALSSNLYRQIAIAFGEQHISLDEKSIKQFLEVETQIFFEEPYMDGLSRADNLIKENIASQAKDILEEVLEEFENGKYTHLRQKIEADLLEHLSKYKPLDPQNLDPLSFEKTAHFIQSIKGAIENEIRRYLENNKQNYELLAQTTPVKQTTEPPKSSNVQSPTADSTDWKKSTLENAHPKEREPTNFLAPTRSKR